MSSKRQMLWECDVCSERVTLDLAGGPTPFGWLRINWVEWADSELLTTLDACSWKCVGAWAAREASNE